MKRKGQIIIGLALILIFILMALAAPVLAPNDPNLFVHMVDCKADRTGQIGAFSCERNRWCRHLYRD